MAGKIVNQQGFKAVNNLATFDPSRVAQKKFGPYTGRLVKAVNDGNSNVSNVFMGAAALKGAYDTGKESIEALRQANKNPEALKNMMDDYTLSNYGGRRKRKRTKHRRSKR